jgi:putative glycosyltransferase (TIGR04348 family)
MKAILITPAPPQSRSGNRKTAARWARMLRQLGHRVQVAERYRDERVDLMIALHAYRSAESIARFRCLHPTIPLIVALTGTDIYHFIHTRASTVESMEMADCLVGLHEAVYDAVPSHLHPKLRVIFQSAEPLSRRYPSTLGRFHVCVIGHLRDEKDPLRTALAARDLPAHSRILVTHLGKALNPDWERQARHEMAVNPRYRWLDEVPRWRVRQILARSQLMVLSSKMEGGANVISEAVVAGVPVVASQIPGSIGLLGEDYPAYFPPGDTSALTRMLERAEQDILFYQRLRQHCGAREPLFRPEREQAAWRELLTSLTTPKRPDRTY